MKEDLTRAELKAEAATKLAAFPVNIHKIRDQVQTILKEWKSGGFFREYTDHSFDHVRDMLEALDWLIPAETQAEMTSADWFMLVLSIYFHDIGLLVTQSEYANRHSDSDFKAFLDNPILAAEKNDQFKAKLDTLAKEESERLRFEEYVRFSHGKRVRSWLEGKSIITDAHSPLKEIVE